MKRFVSMFLAVVMLLVCMLAGGAEVFAAGPADVSRTIAIVFDNSGSMYDSGDQAWCRATYAMEVFASMLNTGDTLQIYPMHPIKVGGAEYTMEKPFQLTDSAQASSIREIFTEDASGTPIESIDCAVTGLQGIQSGKKYLVVLTDGGTFSKGGSGMTKVRTVSELDKRIEANAGENLSVMYLGIGSEACIPNTAESEYFVKRQAVKSEDVLSTLTFMCNRIFGRDTLPRNHVNGNAIDFDISMKKLIIFVQGENIADLKITEEAAGQPISTRQPKYSTAGAGDYKSVPDTTLQGMMVTYTDVAAGTYNLTYTGTPTSSEIYYEPDADLDFVFTDAAGNDVDPNALTAGDYKVSFGMKDAKTGQLIESDLLGNPHYEGYYSINGEQFPIVHDGHSGEVPVTLDMNDVFDARLTVTYLSGYTITKDSTDFGWPEGGIRTAVSPLGQFEVKLQAEKDYILISELKEKPVVAAQLLLDGQPLSPETFAATQIEFDCSGLDFEGPVPVPQESGYVIQLLPTENIQEGSYPVTVTAQYADAYERTATAQGVLPLTLSNTALWLKWLIGILLLLLLILLIWLIMHIKVFPKTVKQDTDSCAMSVGGRDKASGTTFRTKFGGKKLSALAEYNGETVGIALSNLKPGPNGILSKPSRKRNILVANPTQIGTFGDITQADVNGVLYVLDKKTGKLMPEDESQRPYILANGAEASFEGKIMEGGKEKKFHASVPLSFK